MLFETAKRTSIPRTRRNRFRRKGSEDGAIAIITAVVILVMIGMFGMAIDLSRSYNRKAELQSAADAAALAAAAALNGTEGGIDNAVTKAKDAAELMSYSYGGEYIAWSGEALTFGTKPDGGPTGWMNAAAAKLSTSKTFFARVDTSALDAKHGKLQNFLMPILSSALAESNVAASAVAGRDSLNVLPLAVCANSDTAATSLLPSGELVEYGFRRGVAYNLMNLNPGGRSPENFLVNPVAPPGTLGTATMMDRLDVVAPFICTGRMAIPTLQGGDITVERSFPINSQYVHLNSRFGMYAPPSVCLASSAPADPNVRSFDLTNATWMKYKPDGLSANPLPAPDPLLTTAEKSVGATNTAYGPLWTYAKAAKYSSYVANGGVEPVAGYATFSTTDWAQLYDPGKPEAQSYPSTTPYLATGGLAYKPSRTTRVLHIPLLRCPVSAGAKTTATVVGIAKFFMTVPASSSALYAEFAGMDIESALSGDVRLYK